MNNYDVRQTCPRCGACNYERGSCNFELGGVDSWRWNGEHWEHRCDDLDPQIGHFQILPGSQKTDRELVNELIHWADRAGRKRMKPYPSSTIEERHQRDEIANTIVERLIKRDERIEALLDEIADLKHELNGYR